LKTIAQQGFDFHTLGQATFLRSVTDPKVLSWDQMLRLGDWGLHTTCSCSLCLQSCACFEKELLAQAKEAQKCNYSVACYLSAR